MKAVGHADDDSKATEHFLRCISVDDRGVDAIDRGLDDMLVVAAYECHEAHRRSEIEISKLDAIFTSLEQKAHE